MTASRALPCFSCGSRSCHHSCNLNTKLSMASIVPISQSQRIRTYSRYTATGSMTVFKPILDSCLPNTAAMPMPVPMTMILTAWSHTTHLRSLKSRAVQIPTTIRNIKGKKSCKIGTNARLNTNVLPKIARQSLLIQTPISLPSVTMNGSKPCTNAITKLTRATMPLIRPTVTIKLPILANLTVSAVLRDFQLLSSSFSRFSCCLSRSDRSLAACSSSSSVCFLTCLDTAAAMVSFSAFCCSMRFARSTSQLRFLAS